MKLNPSILYAKPVGNPEQKDNETDIYRHSDMIGKVLGEESRNLTLHDAFNKRLETPHE